MELTMPNPYFQFKQFTIHHDRCAMKVTTDACLFGAWCAHEIQKAKYEIRSTKYEERSTQLLDIGAGTGLLSLMVAQKNDCTIDAVEIEKEAAEQAAENIAASPWKENIRIHHTDILKFQTEQSYDVIISNPPFYEKEIVSADQQKNTAHHSDELKLSELISCIKNHLSATGIFYLLLPFKRTNEALKILSKEGLLVQKQVVVAPSVVHAPFRFLIKGGRQQAMIIEEKFFITDEQKQYTPEFVALLKDYYLYL
jgi:tRNA1Val (adenine37-N6)-methyltransferase